MKPFPLFMVPLGDHLACFSLIGGLDLQIAQRSTLLYVRHSDADL